ncbi:MAG TPA: NAD-dependent epimerase/dehydratase family protein, partial [Chloroflexota bacterium]|nr:NAD-dependent epimerase/dehydratase family protein [Chloroflexota bacterium]
MERRRCRVKAASPADSYKRFHLAHVHQPHHNSFLSTRSQHLIGLINWSGARLEKGLREIVMRVILTGASGLIGTSLALRLLDEGHEVFGVDKDPNPWTDRVAIHREDLRGAGPEDG